MIVNFKTFLSLVIVTGLSIGCVISSIVIYNTAQKSIADSFSARIEGIGYTVSALISLEDMKAIQQLPEDDVVSSLLYLSYHRPLNQTLLDTNATYLYIFNYGGDDDISYCVDAEPYDSSIWCAPNESEISGDEDLKYGLFNAFRNTGGVSDLVDTNEWGLMISGTFPIIDDNIKRSFYMTGVDFTLEDIVPEVFKVMTKVWGAYIVVITIAVMLALLLAKKVTKDLDTVRGEILKIGAGKRSTINLKNIDEKLSDIVKEIHRYTVQSRNQLIDLKYEQLELKKEMLNRFLISNIDSYYGDYRFEFINDNEFFCDAIIDGNQIITYSLPKQKNKNFEKMKTLAIKRKIFEDKNADYLLGMIANQYAIFNFDGKLLYSNNSQASIEIYNEDKLIKINFLSNQTQTSIGVN